MGVNISSRLHKERDIGRIEHILSQEHTASLEPRPFYDPLQIVFIKITCARH